MLLNDLNMDWSPRNTHFLNSKITDDLAYKKVMLERMKHILKDLSYEFDKDINTEAKQKVLIDQVIERMWH